MDKPSSLTPLEAVNRIRDDHNGQVVVVLQGGGALGAYQGGVYQALHEAGVEPDWIIGTSIGAINASLIAGNKVEERLERLQDFWRRVERTALWIRWREASPASLKRIYARSWACRCRLARITRAITRPSHCGAR